MSTSSAASRAGQRLKEFREDWAAAQRGDSWGWELARRLTITLLVVTIVGLLEVQIGVLTGAASVGLRAGVVGALVAAMGLIFRNHSPAEYSGHEVFTNFLMVPFEDWSWRRALTSFLVAIVLIGAFFIVAIINWAFFNDAPFTLAASETAKPAAVSLGAFFVYTLLPKLIVDHTHAYFSVSREVYLARTAADASAAGTPLPNAANVDSVLVWRPIATGLAYAGGILAGELTGGSVNFWRSFTVAVVNDNTAGRGGEFGWGIGTDLLAPLITVAIYLFLFNWSPRRSSLKYN